MILRRAALALAVVAAGACAARGAVDLTQFVPNVKGVARIRAVPDATHVVVDRGRAEGVLPDRRVEVRPFRPPKSGEEATISWSVVSAAGSCTEIREHDAVVTLYGGTAEVRVGDRVVYWIPQQPAWLDDALFEVAAGDVRLTGHDGRRLLDFAALRADTEAAGRAALLATLVDDLHASADRAAAEWPPRIEGGRWHGRAPQDVLRAVTLDDVSAFLEYVRSYVGTYAGRDFVFAEAFGEWVYAGGPSADAEVMRRRAEPLRREADAAMARGEFDVAEEACRRALALVPSDGELQRYLRDVITIRQLKDRLAADPDDTALRWRAFHLMAARNALAAAEEQLGAIEASGYDPDECLMQHGVLDIRRGRWKEGKEKLRRVKGHERDRELLRWIAHAEAWERADETYEAWLRFARLYEDVGDWSRAAVAFGEALRTAKTEEERSVALRGQEEIASRQRVDQLYSEIRSGFENHAVGPGQVAGLTEMIKLSFTLPGGKERALDLVSRLAEAARRVEETDVAVGMLRSRSALDPGNADAWRDLAAAELDLGRYDEARASLEKALTLEPKSARGLALRAVLRLARDDLAGAAADADAASVPGYAWPRQLAAGAAAAQGRWDAAVHAAQDAQGLQPESTDAAQRVAAAKAGRAAAAALAANRDDARQRLRLVRALLALGAPRAAMREAAAVRGTAERAEAQRAIGLAEAVELTPVERLAALDAAGPPTPQRTMVKEMLLARRDVGAHAVDVAARVRLARALVVAGHPRRALAALSDVRMAGRMTPAAEDVAETARRELRADDDYRTATDALDREDDATAIPLLERALGAYTEVGSTSGQLAVRFLLAQARRSTTTRAARLAELEAVARDAAAFGATDVARDAARTAAEVAAEGGDLEALVRAAEESLVAARAADDADGEIRALIDLSEAQAGVGRPAPATENARTALARARDIGHRPLEREALVVLASRVLASGKSAEAQALAGELLARSREAADVFFERRALQLLGNVAQARGDVQGALGHFAALYELGRRAGNSADRALARLFEGRVLHEGTHDPKAAIEAFGQAATIFASVGDESLEAVAWQGEGEARTAIGDLARARSLIERARERFVTLHRAGSLAYLGTTAAELELAAGKPEAARAAAARVIAAAREREDADLQWLGHDLMARALVLDGKVEEAVAEYELAVAGLTELLTRAGGDVDRERWLGVGRRRAVFGEAVDLLVRLGRTDRALELAQLSRDAQLRAKLPPGAVRTKPEVQRTLGELDDAAARAQAARTARAAELDKPEGQRSAERLAALSELAAKSEGELKQLLLRLKLQNRALFAMFALQREKVAEVRESLPDDALVVQYYVTDDATYVFTLRRGRPQTSALKVAVKGSDLGDAVVEYVAALKAELPRAPRLGAQLYDWLLAPVEAEMAAAHTTLIVPFGALHYLPFHTLGKAAPDGGVAYAIERFRIAYLSSTVKMDADPAARAAPTLLAFANPDGSLAGARAEVERVVGKKYFPSKVLFEQEAKKARFYELAPSFRVLHFATHGFVGRDPAASYLKLADGNLTVDEITGFVALRGNTDLVVLSACETAIEKGKATDDEPVTIASAFADAGAPALVGSLWSVSDAATSELMGRFYEALAHRDAAHDTLDALRAAQLALLHLEVNGGRPYEAPRYWAAFELFGDYR